MKKTKINTRLVIGLGLFIAIMILGFVVPPFAPENPETWNTYPKNQLPGSEHILGTTGLGQDTFWMLTWSLRNSLILGLLVAVSATFIGVIVGLLAGLKGGFPDRVLSLLMDSMIVIPVLPILILAGALSEGRSSFIMIVVVLVAFMWPGSARQIRSVALGIRESEFIYTAMYSGEGTTKILFREIFPYISSWTLGSLINLVLVAITIESGIALIGLSSLSEATLGTMIYWAQTHMALLAGRTWWYAPPIVMVVLLFVTLFMFSTGYNDYIAKKRQ
ncbi:MAG: ABC transporter permease [Anaerolineales bacterium]|jgi:peptide/nickel transport system permease protein